MNVGPMNFLRVQTLSICTLLMLSVSCAERPSMLKTDQELAANTEIYIGHDEYSVAIADGQQTDLRSGEREDGPTGAEGTPSDGTTGAGAPPKPKPKPKPKPVDVEYILTKAKAISVGLTSDAPQPRVVNDSKAFIPASVTKMMTTASALKILGPQFRFKTVVSFKREGEQAKDIVVVADGDPTAELDGSKVTDGNRFKDIATRLKAMGIKEVSGSLILVPADARLDRQQIPDGTPIEDLRECYGAFSGAFNFKGNCAVARINSKSAVNWEIPELASFITGQIETEPGQRNSIGVKALVEENRILTGFRVYGTYNEKKPQVISLRLPVPNSAVWFGYSLLDELKSGKTGLRVDGVVVQHALDSASRQRALAATTDPSRERIEIDSIELEKIVDATNKPSDNFLADSLFKAMGSRSQLKNQDVLSAARSVVASNIQEWVKADGNPGLSAEMNINDGAGLSTKNRMSPRALLSVLRQLRREPYFELFRKSLPVAGRDGTLAGRMRGSAADGVVFAKTGTLSGSYQLAGYIASASGDEYVPFVILTDTTVGNKGRVREFQDILVAKIANSVRRRR